MMHIFFDFDGTLADSSEGIYLAFAVACKEAEIIAPDYDQFCACIGPPIQVIAKKLVPSISTERLESLRSRFRSEYDNKYYVMTRWYEGVIDGLRWLATIPDISLSIITNKPTLPTASIIRMAGIETLFTHVIGVDYREENSIGATFISKTEAIGFALSLTQCARERSVYIGDTPSDHQASLQQEISFVGVTYGFHQWKPIELEDIVAASSFAGAIAALKLGSRRPPHSA
jgi:phosphoglycolate phosphatase